MVATIIEATKGEIQRDSMIPNIVSRKREYERLDLGSMRSLWMPPQVKLAQKYSVSIREENSTLQKLLHEEDFT
ncbi:unnamed protein product [Sphenostylis stenocarpa]|uniref:Uncharacterized protein n=1 Tax=Sphenostylis stenocarpa TaxID=92480 RepID=A0AA86VA91_9FABA|nr:unnamed protein product [Sphenostylis stenocarpa]